MKDYFLSLFQWNSSHWFRPNRGYNTAFNDISIHFNASRLSVIRSLSPLYERSNFYYLMR
jgi:hypothetical protein